jgi:hypothetical protein
MKLLEHPFIQSISELRRDALLDEIEILKLKLKPVILFLGKTAAQMHFLNT